MMLLISIEAGAQVVSDALPNPNRNDLTVLEGNLEGGTIVGTVIDANFRYPIHGAKVEILGTDKSATTSKDGQYRITSVPKGYYQISVSLDGYISATQNNVRVESGGEQAAFFELKMQSDIPPDFVPVEKQPMPTANPSPKYPESAIKEKVEGVVWLKLVVDTDGNAGKVTVFKSAFTRDGVEIKMGGVDSSGKEIRSSALFQVMKEMNEAAIEAGRHWKFTPAMLSGKSVSVWVSIPFKFKLSTSSKDPRPPKPVPEKSK
jgi:hypothetical protein